MRDTALLELEKRIYNTINKRFTSRDYMPLLEINQKRPNFFNGTSWTRNDFNNLMRPIFTRWSSENALNYHENTGYSLTLSFTPNVNYNVSNYVQSGYVPTTNNLKLTVGEIIIGQTSGTKAKVKSISEDTNTVAIETSDDVFITNEVVKGQSNRASLTPPILVIHLSLIHLFA